MYSIRAPNERRASTNSPMGLCLIRSDPVITHSPMILDKNAVMNLIAVPAAWISKWLSFDSNAFTITRVSSQSDKFWMLYGL